MGIGIFLALSFLGRVQVFSIISPVAAATMSALPAYSALLLMAPSPTAQEGIVTCWDILHGPTFTPLVMMCLATAMSPLMQTSNPSQGCFGRAVLIGLKTVRHM